jgi:hypothetical protein
VVHMIVVFYKRLMRSMSSSLSNSQIINNNEDSNLNDSFNNINDNNVIMCKQCVCSHLLFSSLPTKYFILFRREIQNLKLASLLYFH